MSERPETEDILEKIWRVCKDTMWRQAWRILGSRADAEDALMDAMERIARNRHKFDRLQEGELIALARIYVRHTAIDIYNRRKNAPVLLEDQLEDADMAQAADPAESVLLDTLTEAVYGLLAEMPPAMRDVLQLHCRYELSAEEIAASLDLRTGTVRTRLSRARRWLKEKLAEKGMDVYG